MAPITYLQGDITLASEPVIVHGCNAQGVMGSGVAKALRERWPSIFPPYAEFCDGKAPRKIVGSIIPVEVEHGKWVINAITQETYGRQHGTIYVSYSAVRMAMIYIADFMSEHDMKDLALPKIGAGLGGGEWPIIEAIIKQELCPYFGVTIYEL